MARKKKTHDTLRSDGGMAVLAEVTESIRRRRIELRLRQVDVAALCGCSRQAYVNFERGEPCSTLILVGALRALGLAGCFVDMANGGISNMSSRERVRLAGSHAHP